MLVGSLMAERVSGAFMPIDNHAPDIVCGFGKLEQVTILRRDDALLDHELDIEHPVPEAGGHAEIAVVVEIMVQRVSALEAVAIAARRRVPVMDEVMGAVTRVALRTAKTARVAADVVVVVVAAGSQPQPMQAR